MNEWEERVQGEVTRILERHGKPSSKVKGKGKEIFFFFKAKGRSKEMKDKGAVNAKGDEKDRR